MSIRQNLIKKIDIPAPLVASLFLFFLVLLLAPYIGGTDFGIFKIPVFTGKELATLKVFSPLLFLIFLCVFIPLFKIDSDVDEVSSKSTSPNIKLNEEKFIHADSKHIVQSTPDIILHELDKNEINTNGIRISAGFNINDLRKRISILNSGMNMNSIDSLIATVREIAFTEKYAAPKEDEKLLANDKLKELGLRPWDYYLDEFARNLGIETIDDITVLDVGIGNGHASHAFLKKCRNLYGIDVSQKALSYAKDKLPNAVLSVNSAENLIGIKSFSVDLYLSLRTYQSTLFDMKQSLHEAYRVLARGGGIIISIPSIYFSRDKEGNITSYAKGLIPPYSKEPSMSYAKEIAERIKFYLDLLGFYDTIINENSPYEIFIGGRKA